MTMQVYKMSEAGRRCFERLQIEAALKSGLSVAGVTSKDLQSTLAQYYRDGYDNHLGSLLLIQDETRSPCYGHDGKPVQIRKGRIVNLNA